MIIYGIVAQQSVPLLFLAGFVPGILIGLALALYVMSYARVKRIPIGEPARWKTISATAKDAIWAILAPIVILGGIYGGLFTPTDDLRRAAGEAQELNLRLIERTKAAGAMRADVTADDLSFVFEQLAAIRVDDEQRTAQLRHRYLALQLDALHNPSTTALPGPPPSWEEISQRWEA